MSKRYRLGVYFPMLIIGIIVTTVLRVVASIFDFDFVYGYYYGSTVFNVSVWLTVAFSVLLMSFAFFPSKSKEPEVAFATPSIYFPSAFICIGLVFTALGLFLKSKDAPTVGSTVFSIPINTVALIGGILALASAVYFVLACILTEEKNDLRAWFGMVTVLFLVVYATYLYFNTDLAINAHVKVIDQLSYVFAAIFFLYETRISLGRGAWRLYVSFGMVSALLCAYSAIPTLVTYFVKGQLLSDSLHESVMTVSILVFIISRLIQAAISRERGSSKTALSIKEASEARAESIARHERELMQTIEESETARIEGKRIAEVAELHELIPDVEDENEETEAEKASQEGVETVAEQIEEDTIVTEQEKDGE